MATQRSETTDRSPLAAGLGGLGGGLIGGTVGWLVAPALVDVSSGYDADNLVGNSVLIIGLLLLAGYAAATGFVVGSWAGAATLLKVLGRVRVPRTLLYIFLLDSLAVPVGILLLLLLDGRGVPLWLNLGVSGTLVGGAVPALSRMLAIRAAEGRHLV